VYTPNLHIKKAVTPEKTMGYGFSSLEKILFYNKLTLEKSIIKNIRVIQNPEISLSPIKPKKRLNVLLAGVVAFMMMMFLAFFVEYIRKAKSNNNIK